MTPSSYVSFPWLWQNAWGMDKGIRCSGFHCAGSIVVIGPNVLVAGWGHRRSKTLILRWPGSRDTEKERNQGEDIILRSMRPRTHSLQPGPMSWISQISQIPPTTQEAINGGIHWWDQSLLLCLLFQNPILETTLSTQEPLEGISASRPNWWAAVTNGSLGNVVFTLNGPVFKA